MSSVLEFPGLRLRYGISRTRKARARGRRTSREANTHRWAHRDRDDERSWRSRRLETSRRPSSPSRSESGVDRALSNSLASFQDRHCVALHLTRSDRLGPSPDLDPSSRAGRHGGPTHGDRIGPPTPPLIQPHVGGERGSDISPEKAPTHVLGQALPPPGCPPSPNYTVGHCSSSSPFTVDMSTEATASPVSSSAPRSLPEPADEIPLGVVAVVFLPRPLHRCTYAAAACCSWPHSPSGSTTPTRCDRLLHCRRHRGARREPHHRLPVPAQAVPITGLVWPGRRPAAGPVFGLHPRTPQWFAIRSIAAQSYSAGRDSPWPLSAAVCLASGGAAGRRRTLRPCRRSGADEVGLFAVRQAYRPAVPDSQGCRTRSGGSPDDASVGRQPRRTIGGRGGAADGHEGGVGQRGDGPHVHGGVRPARRLGDNRRPVEPPR